MVLFDWLAYPRRSTLINSLRWVYIWLLFNTNTFFAQAVETHTEKAVRHMFDSFSTWISGMGANHQLIHGQQSANGDAHNLETIALSDPTIATLNDSSTKYNKNIRSRPLTSYYRQATLPSEMRVRQTMNRYGHEYNSDHPNDVFKFPRAQQGDVCELPQVIGTGPYRIPRWYFNPNTKRCELFYYSGCCGNGNNFPTYESCQVLCEEHARLKRSRSSISRTSKNWLVFKESWNTSSFRGAPLMHREHEPNPVDACFERVSIGRGPYVIPRWYYNVYISRCQLFYFTGCGAGRNNFPTCNTCQAACEVDPCTQDRDPGVGSLQIPRYHFNQQTKFCEQFTYFGSGGNRNNFATLEECRARCPENPNPCAYGDPMRTGNGGFMQCGFSLVVTNTCPVNYYCHVGSSVTTTICCPKGPGDRCDLRIRIGLGSENLPRWYFDSVKQDCREFQYKGLQGNENNFLSKADCDNACFVNPCAQGDPYRSGGTVVQCSAHNQGVCASSYYCHIGAELRTTVCCPVRDSRILSVLDPCSKPLQPGQGKHTLERYYFNINTRTCDKFLYRGTKGNANNFLHQFQCKIQCPVFRNPCAGGSPALNRNGGPISCANGTSCHSHYYCHFGVNQYDTVCCPSLGKACSLILSQGVGVASLERYYYNSSNHQCYSFTYRGMKGNDNNFQTKQQCASKCPGI